MFFLFIIYLCQSCVFSVLKKRSKFSKLIKYKLVQTFVLVILLSYQQIITGAFTLVKCINIANVDILYIQGNIQCFTLWQIVLEILKWVSIFPSFFVFSHVPYYVDIKEMSVQMFILVCLLPVPGLIIFHLRRTWKKFKMKCYVQKHSDIKLKSAANRTKALELNQSEVNPEEISSMLTGMVTEQSLDKKLTVDTLGLSCDKSDSDIDIASEYNTDLLPHSKTDVKQRTLTNSDINNRHLTETDEDIQNQSHPNSKGELFVDSKDAIRETLLKHFKTMKLFGIRFNWFAVHKIYRMSLVACSTYISDSITRPCTMSSILLCILLLHFILSPYKHKEEIWWLAFPM